MTLYRYKNVEPQVGEGCFIAKSADVIGKVFLGKNSSLWFQVVARGDVNEIRIGENVNIQDLTMLHVVEDLPLIIKDNVSVGHSVTLHACTVEEGCLIGMGATILDGAVIGKSSIVAGGSVVPPGKVYPPESFIIGTPAVVKRRLTPKEVDTYSNHYKSYLITKDEFLKEVEIIS